MSFRGFSLLAAAAIALISGCQRAFPPDAATVAVSSSYLEAAARDLLGATATIARLAEPGGCPGHSDFRPAQVERIRRARVLVRFDFQESWETRLREGFPSGKGPSVVRIALPGGMGEPATYLAACRQTAEGLAAAGMLTPADAERRLAEIAARLDALTDACRRQAAEFRGAPVLCSMHQERFCRWLGLTPVGVFRATDGTKIREVETALRSGARARVRWVIANAPEGRRLADALAERLGAKVVVFDNFPERATDPDAFDGMVARNVARLKASAGP